MLNIAVAMMKALNPTEDRALADDEITVVRLQLDADEEIKAYVRGWETGRGSALWVLTGTRLHRLQLSERAGSRVVALSALRGITAEQGRYGAVVVLQEAGGRHALMGADGMLATGFVRSVGEAARVASEIESGMTLPSAGSAARMWALAQARVRPVEPVAEALA